MRLNKRGCFKTSTEEFVIDLVQFQKNGKLLWMYWANVLQIFFGGEPTLWGGRNIDGVKLPFLFRDFVAPRVDPVGKKISQKIQ